MIARLFTVLALLLCVSCTISYPNRNPVGEPFPLASGESLAGEATELPTDLSGSPAVLLVGYEQDSQFDLDRWILGLQQAEISVRALEVPTIPAGIPTMISGWIDNGMRRGIPQEDWAGVVTLYGAEADKVARFTGTEKLLNGRILLLDAQGVVRWFWDQGYSARRLLHLDKAIEALGRAR